MSALYFALIPALPASGRPSLGLLSVVMQTTLRSAYEAVLYVLTAGYASHQIERLFDFLIPLKEEGTGSDNRVVIATKIARIIFQLTAIFVMMSVMRIIVNTAPPFGNIGGNADDLLLAWHH
mmetsp:Transcript_14159/g.19662  ORF Transcript_14159/g.19662 Transcript_14159/m.19662 type:complete len:122 (+) Transcript_14159:57-422(+)